MEDFVTWVDTSKLKRTIMRYNDEVSLTTCLPFTAAHYLFLVGRFRSPMSFIFVSVYYISYSPSDRQGHIFFVSAQSRQQFVQHSRHAHHLISSHATKIHFMAIYCTLCIRDLCLNSVVTVVKRSDGRTCTATAPRTGRD